MRFGLLERKRDNEAIVDFLLSPGLSESVEFNVLRYAAGADRKGLIAAHYLFRFNLGELDGNDLKKVRRQAIDAMARFEMQAVHAHFATRRRSE